MPAVCDFSISVLGIMEHVGSAEEAYAMAHRALHDKTMPELVGIKNK